LPNVGGRAFGSVRNAKADLACTGAYTGASTQGAPFGDVNFGEKEELR